LARNAILETTIKITPMNISCEQKFSDGSSQYKQISEEDFKSVLDDSTIETPLLPLNVIHYSKQGGNKWSIVSLITPQLIDMMVDGRGHEDFTVKVPIPYMLFGFTIQAGSVVKSQACALTNNPLENGDYGVFNTPLSAEERRSRTASGMRTPTFIFPYGNTFGDFRICWGNIQLPRINDPIEVNQLIRMFFAGKCNGDLFSVNANHDFTSYMRHCDGKAEVNYNDLVPHNATVQDFINRLK
jgi:hypothetical protein